MRLNTLKSSAYVGLLTAASIGLTIAPAEAFQLVGTSASFDNAVLGDGTVVGSGGVAPSGDNLIEFLDVNGESQVRWGDAVYGTEQETQVWREWEEWQDGEYSVVNSRGKGNWYFRNNPQYDKGQCMGTNWRGNCNKWQVKGWQPGQYVTQSGWVTETETVYTYENKSGLGFAGVGNLDLTLGEAFNIGTLKHFNETIWSGTAAHKADFSLDIAFADAELGTQKFDFSLKVDETLNSQEVCPYHTEPGQGCSDQITWDFELAQSNTFTYEGEEYKFQLVGFTEAELSSANITEEFISQEGGTSEANLWAKVVKVNPDYSGHQEVPEPGNFLGLGLAAGAMVTAAKRKQLQAAKVQA